MQQELPTTSVVVLTRVIACALIATIGAHRPQFMLGRRSAIRVTVGVSVEIQVLDPSPLDFASRANVSAMFPGSG